jgi:hypothetical protein
MPAPINYTAGFINPSDSIQQMLQMGGQLAQLGQFRDQRLASQQATEDARISAEQKAARDAEIKGLYEQAIANPTWENYNKLAMLDPANSEKIIKTWGMVDTEQQQTALNESMRIFAGLTSGDPKAGLNLLEERRNAALNAKDEDSAKKYQSMIEMFNSGDKGPGMVAVTFGTTISGMPGGKDAMDAYAKYRETIRADSELDRVNAELEAAKQTGGLDPEKKFASELSLNKEYEARTKAYNESLRLNSVIKESAAAGTGAGDLALINTFMKMLDPGSVVRESEFAQAQDTAGLVSKLAASLGRVQSGQVLVPAQREEFARLADKYMTAAGVNEKKVRDSLGFIVKSYGLNPENVFGTMAQDKPKAGAVAAAPIDDVAALKAYIVSRFPGEAAKINGLDLAGLQREYPKSVASYHPAAVGTPAVATKTTEVDF